MPCTVSEIFSAAGLRPAGSQRWGTPIPESGPGVYVVALTADPDEAAGAALGEAPIAPERVQELLDARPELRLDGMRPDAALLSERLRAFWLPDEVVVYIGMAGTSVRNRVGAYYRSPLGARRPHSGGWFLKTLGNLADLTVHHAPCEDPVHAEHLMLEAFSAGVTPASAAALRDRELPIPFANLEWPPARRKEHGITGARGPRLSGPMDAPTDRPAAVNGTATKTFTTQRITAADLRDGRIRVPRAAKALFPAQPGPVHVILRGTTLQCRWDPRVGPKKQRSGLLDVPADILDGLVSVDEILAASGHEAAVRLD